MARAVGLAPWSPNADSLELVTQINRILDEYRDHLPLTGRQVFYRLVGTTGYSKTEKSYKSLLEKINRARRGGLIRWSAIRDDGVSIDEPWGYVDEQHFYDGIKSSAEHFRLDRSIGQSNRVEVWVEAAGMVPQMARVLENYGVAVYSSGGFNSTTMKYNSSKRFMNRHHAGLRTTVLHLGDHDPSGVAIFDNLKRDTWAFCEDLAPFTGLGGHEVVTWKRLAVTEEQAEEMELESAPPKPTDSRSANWYGGTYQAEAIDPADLATIVSDAAEAELDMSQLHRLILEEDAIRERLVDWVEEAMSDE